MGKSICNCFSGINLQIGSECGEAIKDVLHETKFHTRNLRDAMKAVREKLCNIANLFENTAQIYEIKVDYLFSKIGTFQLNSENRLITALTQVVHNNEAVNSMFESFISSLENNYLQVLDEISEFAASLWNRLDDLPFTKILTICYQKHYPT
jgi:hypothetical protein